MIFDAPDKDLAASSWVDSRGYVRTYCKGSKTRRAHRIVAERMLGRKLSKKEYVDHINRNASDNRRNNLRVVSQSENMMNQVRKKGTKGIRQMPNKRWQARITAKKIVYHLGTFTSKEEALAAYNRHCKRLHREYGRINQ